MISHFHKNVHFVKISAKNLIIAAQNHILVYQYRESLNKNT